MYKFALIYNYMCGSMYVSMYAIGYMHSSCDMCIYVDTSEN